MNKYISPESIRNNTPLQDKNFGINSLIHLNNKNKILKITLIYHEAPDFSSDGHILFCLRKKQIIRLFYLIPCLRRPFSNCLQFDKVMICCFNSDPPNFGLK